MSYKVGDKVLFEVNILHFDKQSTYPVQAEGTILSPQRMLQAGICQKLG